MSALLADMEQLQQLPAVVDGLRAEVARLWAMLKAPRELDPERLVTVKEAAALAGLSAGAIYTRCWRGLLRRHPFPGSKRYAVRLGDVLVGGGT